MSLKVNNARYAYKTINIPEYYKLKILTKEEKDSHSMIRTPTMKEKRATVQIMKVLI